MNRGFAAALLAVLLLSGCGSTEPLEKRNSDAPVGSTVSGTAETAPSATETEISSVSETETVTTTTPVTTVTTVTTAPGTTVSETVTAATTKPLEFSELTKLVYAKGYVTFRTDPYDSATIIRFLDPGSELTVGGISEDGRWYRIGFGGM